MSDAPRKLFLAKFTLSIYGYMENPREKELSKLVWGVDEEDAERKLKEKFEVEEPYATSKYISNLELDEAIE